MTGLISTFFLTLFITVYNLDLILLDNVPEYTTSYLFELLSSILDLLPVLLKNLDIRSTV
jgi:hypothetical protein